MTKRLSEAAQVAKLIRKEIKELLPKGAKASVTSKTYSMGCRVNVVYEDQSPETHNLVKEVLSKYEYGHFDGSQDSYEYSNKRKDLPQTKYLFIDNNMSLKTEFWQEHQA